MAILEQGAEHLEIGTEHHKLVRTLIPRIIDNNPDEGDPIIMRLDSEQHRIQLLNKLIEEGRELTVEISTRPIRIGKLKEEFADVLEVVNAINNKFEFSQDLSPDRLSVEHILKGVTQLGSSITIFADSPTLENFIDLIDTISMVYQQLKLKVPELDILEIEAIRAKKKDERGGFDEGIFLVAVTKK
jgi:predicted house-cleaning noncanonical NTP pyrophosphatase (MazG superfamily)